MTPFLAAALLAVQVASQMPDTALTKAALLAADAAAGPGTLLEKLEAGGLVLIPGEPIVRGAQGARPAWGSRYTAPGIQSEWTPLHAVASSDGRLGCTTGSTRVQATSDTTPRYGRYLTCWRKSADATWRIVVHARAGEAPNAPRPDGTLVDAPHSATGASHDLDAVLLTDAAFARLALEVGPGLAFGKFAAGDAMLLGGLPTPRRGKEQIRAAFDAFPADQRLMWTPVRDAGAASGGLAVTIGTAAVGSVAGGPENGQSKYVTVWRHESDGSWRFIFDIGSPRPANTPLDGHFREIVRTRSPADSPGPAARPAGPRP